ncbi:MAG: TIGR02147 family protein [bacterium]|nr:TIGR02147 family protein [bacterium]
MEHDIFTYENYRTLLLDYYQSQKQKNPNAFSFRVFSRQAGFNTSNFLQLVIKDKRNLSYQSVKKIARVLSLRGRQYDYFENLVFFNQAKENDVKTKHYERLASFKEYQDVRLLNDTQKVYFSKWFYPVVREMVNLPYFQVDPEWIAKNIQPNITSDDAKEALDILQKIELIEITKNGRCVLKDTQLKTQSQKVGHEVIAYHRRMINHGFSALNKPAKERDISGMTMSISPAKFKLIQKKIAQFREEVQDIVQKPLKQSDIDELYLDKEKKQSSDEFLTVDQVCQLNIQFFQLAGR